MDRNPDMAELIGAEGIFLRTADRRRFDYVLRGVREESLSLSLSSDNDGLLDHYGRLLINKLRKSDGLQVEVFLPRTQKPCSTALIRYWLISLLMKLAMRRRRKHRVEFC